MDDEKADKAGSTWNSDEENQLLFEISQNFSYEKIAKLHKRNIGGIKARIRVLVYEMYKKGISIDEIILKTKLTLTDINDIIARRNKRKEKKEEEKKDISDIKKDISDIKKDIQNILDLIKTFEVSS